MHNRFTRPLIETALVASSFLTWALIGSVVTGCASAPSVEAAGRAPQGSVQLEEVADWSFEAAHPFSIDSASLGRMLRGVMISEVQSDLSSVPVDGSKPMRVFSDEDVRYLAPLLAQALSQAKPEFVVAFRLSSSAGSGSEPTTGSLYAENEQLYLTITQHNGSLAKTDSSLFGKGRAARLVTFEVDSAARVEQTPIAIARGQQGLKSLAIDYHYFAKSTPSQSPVADAAPAPSPALSSTSVAPVVVATAVEDYHRKRVMAGKEAAPEASEKRPLDQSVQEEELAKTKQELDEARQAMAKKDAKINALRRDLESMRVQLESADKELRAVKTRQTQPKREKKGVAELTIR
jgi:hypothetical protein